MGKERVKRTEVEEEGREERRKSSGCLGWALQGRLRGREQSEAIEFKGKWRRAGPGEGKQGKMKRGETRVSGEGRGGRGR